MYYSTFQDGLEIPLTSESELVKQKRSQTQWVLLSVLVFVTCGVGSVKLFLNDAGMGLHESAIGGVDPAADPVITWPITFESGKSYEKGKLLQFHDRGGWAAYLWTTTTPGVAIKGFSIDDPPKPGSIDPREMNKHMKLLPASEHFESLIEPDLKLLQAPTPADGEYKVHGGRILVMATKFFDGFKEMREIDPCARQPLLPDLDAAIAELESNRLLHLDLHPGNVMGNANTGKVAIIDMKTLTQFPESGALDDDNMKERFLKRAVRSEWKNTIIGSGGEYLSNGAPVVFDWNYVQGSMAEFVRKIPDAGKHAKVSVTGWTNGKPPTCPPRKTN